FLYCYAQPRDLHSFPTRRSSDLDYELKNIFEIYLPFWFCRQNVVVEREIELDRFSKIILQTIQSGFTKHSEVCKFLGVEPDAFRSEEHTSELQSRENLVCRLLLD